MNNPFDFFDKILCVNLADRTDRWEECLPEFDKVGIRNKVEKFEAYRYENKSTHFFIGRAGVTTSFKEAVRYARDEGCENVLVLEDDVSFVKDTLSVLEKSLEELKERDWDMFFLGINPEGDTPFESESDHLLRLRAGLCLHAASYNKKFFETVLTSLPEPPQMFEWLRALHNGTGFGAVDGWVMTSVMPNFNVYCTNPMIATQRPSWSSIDNKMVEFGEDLLERFSIKEKELRNERIQD
jgi:hypothetical protein